MSRIRPRLRTRTDEPHISCDHGSSSSGDAEVHGRHVSQARTPVTRADEP